MIKEIISIVYNSDSDQIIESWTATMTGKNDHINYPPQYAVLRSNYGYFQNAPNFHNWLKVRV